MSEIPVQTFPGWDAKDAGFARAGCYLQRPTPRWPQPHVKLVGPRPKIRRDPGHPYTPQPHEEYTSHPGNAQYCRAPSILPLGPVFDCVTAEPSPKHCGPLRRWGTVSPNQDRRTVIAVYLPVAKMGAVASPPCTPLFARPLRLPSSQRRTVPEPHCTVITAGRYRYHMLDHQHVSPHCSSRPERHAPACAVRMRVCARHQAPSCERILRQVMNHLANTDFHVRTAEPYVPDQLHTKDLEQVMNASGGLNRIHPKCD